MSYGDKQWQEWVLGEEEATKHIKFAFVILVLLQLLRRILTSSQH